MRVADGFDGELLHPIAQRLEAVRGGIERARESRLIAAIERGEIDGFDGGIELALVIVLAVGEGGGGLFGGDDSPRRSPGSGWPG